MPTTALNLCMDRPTTTTHTIPPPVSSFRLGNRFTKRPSAALRLPRSSMDIRIGQADTPRLPKLPWQASSQRPARLKPKKPMTSSSDIHRRCPRTMPTTRLGASWLGCLMGSIFAPPTRSPIRWLFPSRPACRMPISWVGPSLSSKPGSRPRADLDQLEYPALAKLVRALTGGEGVEGCGNGGNQGREGPGCSAWRLLARLGHHASAVGDPLSIREQPWHRRVVMTESCQKETST